MIPSDEHPIWTAWRRGWSVIPLRAGSKKPLMEWHLFQERRASELTVTRWLERIPQCNPGIVTGRVSSLLVLDEDGPQGIEWLRSYRVPRTPTVRTPHGHHLYFLYPQLPAGEEIGNFVRAVPGLDLRGEGGYVVGAGAIGEDGTPYRWEISPEECPPADPPEWLLALARGETPVPDRILTFPRPTPEAAERERAERLDKYAHTALDKEIAELRATPEGRRNDALNTAAFSLGQLVGARLLSRGEVERALDSAATAIGLEGREIRATIRSGLDAGEREPREIPDEGLLRKIPAAAFAAAPSRNGKVPPADLADAGLEGKEYNLTDLGNAERLVARHGADIRYCHPWSKWLVWDGVRWQPDATAEVMRMAKETVRSIYAEAAAAADEGGRTRLAKHALRCEAEARIRAMVSLAASEPGVPVLPVQLDEDPWLLNLANGTLDLRTGKLRPQRKADMLTKLAPVTFDPTATCPRWLAFLDEIMLGNKHLVDFLQLAAGYSLTGSTRERALFILYGSGANGKSTFLETVRATLGEYSQRTPTETLLVRRDGGASNDVARLKGARLVTASETDEGKRLAEALIKDLTGGDVVSARFLYAEHFEFRPQCKIFLSTNHKPVIRGTDKGIWDRIRLIPFDLRVPDDHQDKQLGQKLLTELPGILNWTVEGCLRWQRDGLGMPQEVSAATERYRAEMDVLGDFIDECCEISADYYASAKELYAAYRKWCEENREREISQTAFGLRLQERGFVKTRQPHSGTRLWLGLGLRYDDINSGDGLGSDSRVGDEFRRGSLNSLNTSTSLIKNIENVSPPVTRHPDAQNSTNDRKELKSEEMPQNVARGRGSDLFEGLDAPGQRPDFFPDDDL